MRYLFIFCVACCLTGCASFLGTGDSKETCPIKDPKYTCMTPSQILAKEASGGINMPTDSDVQIGNMPPAIWDESTPVRHQPKIYKIWIAPYEDADSNLHWPSVIFTEVSTGKWNFGEKVIKSNDRFIPLQMDHRKKNEKKEKKSNPLIPDMTGE